MRDFFTTCQNDETFISEITTEIVNTDIGYNQEELDATPTDDLMVLRTAIYSYLKSPTLKKRNPNYLKLFKRINEELNRRKLLEEDKTVKKFEIVKFKKINLFILREINLHLRKTN